MRLLRASKIYETAPVEVEGDQPHYLNCVAELECGLPAIPVVDGDDRYAGIFGEREFITALFPGYVSSLKHAAFVPKSIDTVLEKRQTCRMEPVGKHMNT